MSDLTAEYIRLGAENERLREELDKTQRFYIEAGFELRQLREDNKRLEAEKAVWQGVQQGTADVVKQLEAEVATLRAATGSLVRSLSGCWYAFEPSLRREMGNTNYHCVKEKMDEVEALLNLRAARAAYLGVGK